MPRPATGPMEGASTARTLCTAAPIRASRPPTRAPARSAHAWTRAVPEPQLHPLELPVEPALQIARVEQCDPDAGAGGGGDQDLAHRVRIAVRHAAGPVVQIVELPHRRDAAQGHLGEQRLSEVEVALGIEALGDGVHLLPPCPEVARTGLGPASERPVERVRMNVGEPREGDTRKHDCPLRQVTARRHPDEAIPFDIEQHRSRHLAAPGIPDDPELAEVRRQASRPGASKPIGTGTPWVSACSRAWT